MRTLKLWELMWQTRDHSLFLPVSNWVDFPCVRQLYVNIFQESPDSEEVWSHRCSKSACTVSLWTLHFGSDNMVTTIITPRPLSLIAMLFLVLILLWQLIQARGFYRQVCTDDRSLKGSIQGQRRHWRLNKQDRPKPKGLAHSGLALLGR